MALQFNYRMELVDSIQLRTELNNSPVMSSTCTTVLYDDTIITNDNVLIVWSVDLSPAEETEQTNLVTSHVPAIAEFELTDLPRSELGTQLYVHSSSKPSQPGKSFFLGWTGAGDDVNDPINGLGNGELLQFMMLPGNPLMTKRIEFIPDHGEIYIHEGYIKFENGGVGDYLQADVVAKASAIQTVASLDYIIESDWLKISPSGAGTGTHGFAAAPVLIPRTFSKDGDWDYNKTSGLVPNLANNGGYKISTIDRIVHRYINKIPTFGTSYGYTRLTSEETAYLPAGYCLEVSVFNNSDTTWNANVMFEVFRERTFIP